MQFINYLNVFFKFKNDHGFKWQESEYLKKSDIWESEYPQQAYMQEAEYLQQADIQESEYPHQAYIQELEYPQQADIRESE